MDVGQELQLARERHARGDLREAEAHYRRILAKEPRNVAALLGIGSIAQQVGQNEAAAAWFKMAVSVDANHAAAQTQWALVCQQLGNLAAAGAAFERAVRARPNDPELLNQWGICLGIQGKLDEAIAAFKRSIAAAPEYAAAHHNLGTALMRQKRAAEAEAAFRERVRIQPDSVEGLTQLGVVCGRGGRFEEAAEWFARAAHLAPEDPETNLNLGFALRTLARNQEAMDPLQRAVALSPRSPKQLIELAKNLVDLGRHDEAIALFDQVLSINPADIETQGARSDALLRIGRFTQGWRDYESRWRSSTFPHNRRYTHRPQWTGFDISGKTILLHSEQGFGDSIQFVRYAPRVAARGARVVVQCQTELVSLLRTVADVDRVIGDDDPAIPEFDVQCPFMSLPLAFGTTVQTIPGQVPYLRADAALLETWRTRLGEHAGKRKIGLVWAGRATHSRDRDRSVPLEQLAPLGAIEDVVYFSLQKGPAARQAQSPPGGMTLFPLGEQLKDFSDTAAVLAQLDLLISVDTAAVHLAGALGKPVWAMLGSFTDFRWLCEREDSPWYPTLRLFRQRQRGDWQQLIQRVADSLQKSRAS